MSEVYDPKTIDLHNSIGPLVGRVRAALAMAVEEALARDEYDISAAQFGILSTLHNEGQESACDLCRLLRYDRGAMSRMLDRLESKGFVRRVRRSGERRTISLEITAAGEAALPKMQACVVGVVNRFLRGIPKSEVKQAEGVLRRMLANG